MLWLRPMTRSLSDARLAPAIACALLVVAAHLLSTPTARADDAGADAEAPVSNLLARATTQARHVPPAASPPDLPPPPHPRRRRRDPDQVRGVGPDRWSAPDPCWNAPGPR